MEHTILFVDDEPNILTALKRAMRKEDFRVLTADSGAAGIEILTRNDVSVIVSDQNMPGMVGAEFLAKSKELAPHAVRMMLTGYSDIETATRAINEGEISRFITKPWNDEDLALILHDAIRRFNLEGENRGLAQKLSQVNADLENKVRERTHELQTALDENVALTSKLELRVRELEGRDRISRYLLELRPLKEALQMIAETISEVLELGQVSIYLESAEPAWARLATTSETAAPTLSPESVAHLAGEANEVDAGEPGARVHLMPILRGHELLGAVAFGSHAGTQAEGQLAEAVASFCLQAAVAISDAEAHRSLDEWDEDPGDFDLLIEESVPN